MNKPDPYALLLASLVTKWPYIDDDSDGDQSVYLYRMPTLDKWMTNSGFKPPCGVGKRSESNKLVMRLQEVDLVRVSLLWQPDDDVNPQRAAYLGRDVRYGEWLDARNWLLSRTEDEPDETTGT